MAGIKYEIKGHLGVLAEKNSGWKKELNLVSWNDAEAKLDIREWSPDRMKMSRGITLDYEEARLVGKLLAEEFSNEERKGERHEL